MKLSAENLKHKAKKISDDLLCCVGLSNAKKVVGMAKKNLAAEYKRRKNL